MTDHFTLEDHIARTWDLPSGFSGDEFEAGPFYLGEGNRALEVAVANAAGRPTKESMRRLWTQRHGYGASPLLLVVMYDDQAAVCGPAGEEPPVYRDIGPGKVHRIAEESLREPNRHAAIRFLEGALPQLASELSGLKNEGMFATHELEVGVPQMPNWDAAVEEGTALLGKEGRDLVKALGFEIDSHGIGTHTLRVDGVASAIAVFLNKSERPGAASSRFNGNTPVAAALAAADAERRDYVVIVQAATIRIYLASDEDGVGRKGRTETFIQANTSLLSEERAGYLPLIFGSSALAPEGTFENILERSHDFAVALSRRLRERVYNEVVPQIAEMLASKVKQRRDIEEVNLDELYEASMLILFRLLFVAYGEDKNLLPYRSNRRYRRYSLKGLARDLSRRSNNEALTFDDAATSIWGDVTTLWDAIDGGNSDLGVPQYNGGLFDADATVGSDENYLEGVTFTNAEIGPALFALLVDQTQDEVFGPVDFRALSVREFGTVYEGLLESALTQAPTDLTLNSDDQFVPASDDDAIAVQEGDIFLQNQSGKRKETGTYFTKPMLVEHILEQALAPSIDDHLENIERLLEDGKEVDASEAFFDFRCADIAMGSGHFLVAAVDYIEARFSNFLTNHTLPRVARELDKLQSTAENQLESLSDSAEIDRSSLLRRQIARRCVYGVDLNPIAVELARLGIWIHTFVPGLPLSFLDHNLIQGNSLAGIGTIEEALGELGTDDGSEGIPLWRGQIYDQLAKSEDALEKLGRLTDASASEIEKAKEAHQEARAAVGPIEALFDLLAASRQIEHIGLPTDISPEDLAKNKHLADAQAIAEQQDAVHFPVAFPEVFLRERAGFDCILGNPPWEEATVEEDEFWTRHFPGFVTHSQSKQKKLRKKYKEERPDLVSKYEQEVEKAEGVRSMLLNGPYPGMGAGDPDLYKAFSWRFWHLCRPRGKIGVVLPRSALIAKGSSEWRSQVINGGDVLDATLITNTGNWAFNDMEARYTIGLLSVQKTGRPGGVSLRGPFSSLNEFQDGRSNDPVAFTNDQFQAAASNYGFPILGSQSESKVFKRLIESPRFDSDQHSWSCRPVRELDATNDKEHMLFDPGDKSGLWPVYKGASFNIWEPDTGVRYAWADPDDITNVLYEKRKRQHNRSNSAFYHLSDEWTENKTTLPCLHRRIAFRDVSRATDTRTVIAALLPPNITIANTAPYLLFEAKNASDEAYLLGVLCSIPLDWYARRVVEAHLSFYIVNAFPIPLAERSNEHRRRIEEIAGTLAAVDERFADWADEAGVTVGTVSDDTKSDLEAELDALVAHLYGLKESELIEIYKTFHEEWDPTDRMEKALVHFHAYS